MGSADQHLDSGGTERVYLAAWEKPLLDLLQAALFASAPGMQFKAIVLAGARTEAGAWLLLRHQLETLWIQILCELPWHKGLGRTSAYLPNADVAAKWMLVASTV